MVWLPLPCCCRGQVLCVAPIQAKPDSAQQGPASDGLQEDGGSKQMGHEQIGGGSAPQTAKPRRGKQGLVIPGQGEAGNQPPRLHPGPHQVRGNSGYQQQGEGPAAG